MLISPLSMRYRLTALSALALAAFFATSSARAQTSYVYGQYSDLSYPNAFIGGSLPPSSNGINWSIFASGKYAGTRVANFYFDPSTPNNFTNLTITKWTVTGTSPAVDVSIYDGNGTGATTGMGALGTQGSAPITLTGGTGQIDTGTSSNLNIHNNLVVNNSGGAESWNLPDLFTMYGSISGTGAQTITIGGNDPSNIALDLEGVSNASNVSIALNGVQIAISNQETFNNLSLLQNSTINVSNITTTSPKVDTFNGGYTPAGNLLTVTGWQGQIGDKSVATGGTGGLNSQLLFANTVAGTLPNGVVLNTIVYSVVFDLSTNTHGANSQSSNPAGGSYIPNFTGDPGILNTSYDYGEWIYNSAGYDELVPYYGPVPEPATIFAALALVGAIGWRERRRLSSLHAHFFKSSQLPPCA